MLLDRPRADPERRGDVAARLAGEHPPGHLRLADGEAPRDERVDVGRGRLTRWAGSRRDELGVGDRVAVALDEERPRAVDQVAFGVGVIPLVATQGDAEKSLRCGGERERDLVLDAERPVELGVDGGGAQLVLADDVREAVRPAVAGLPVALDQRVLMGEGPEHADQLLTQRGADDHIEIFWRRADVVERHELGGEHTLEGVEEADAELVELEQPLGVGDQLEDAVRDPLVAYSHDTTGAAARARRRCGPRLPIRWSATAG